MLGDGHVSPTQVLVTVNKNEKEYLQRLKELMRGLFGVEPHCSMSKSLNKSRLNVVDIYIGSTKIVKYFLKMGLVMNKVKSQVDIPSWIKENKIFAKGFLRGFFDTDGSIYKLRFGVQLSYTNASLPLLFSARELLIKLGFAPSRIGGISFYLTKRNNLYRFFSEIQPKNQKHIDRARSFGIIE